MGAVIKEADAQKADITGLRDEIAALAAGVKKSGPVRLKTATCRRNS